MIIPSGTEIQIDVHGQLSVRTPGHLVIQNSGHYGEIESVQGSIRIESNAEVEAVSVKCAETCYVQGSLTSWRVQAKSIHLEEKAQARIVLQETDSIEIGRNAKLVGNFDSERELFLLFSRFAQQLRSLPFYFDRREGVGVVETLPPIPDTPPVDEAAAQRAAEARGRLQVSEPSSRVLEAGAELPDQLFFALVLLEREARNDAYGSTSVRVVEELAKLLRDRDLETLRHTRTTLFSRIVEPGDDIRRARELIDGFFGGMADDGT
ncbi:MAG: hypothetical protein AAGE94_07765 [Acidobacteriota bacterium]